MRKFLLAMASAATLIPAAASARGPIIDDGYGYPHGYGYGAPYQRYGFRPEDRDADYPDRLVRDGDRALAYDRDYPFQYRYGGEGAYDSYDGDAYGSGRHTMTEMIVTTTEPSTVRRRYGRRSGR